MTDAEWDEAIDKALACGLQPGDEGWTLILNEKLAEIRGRQ